MLIVYRNEYDPTYLQGGLAGLRASICAGLVRNSNICMQIISRRSPRNTRTWWVGVCVCVFLLTLSSFETVAFFHLQPAQRLLAYRVYHYTCQGGRGDKFALFSLQGLSGVLKEKKNTHTHKSRRRTCSGRKFTAGSASEILIVKMFDAGVMGLSTLRGTR